MPYNRITMMRTTKRFLLTVAIIGLLIKPTFLVKAQDSTLFFDDPIAGMLDSLMHANFYEKVCAKPVFPKSNKYNFAPDSVPRYDDAYYRAKLAKLDAQTPFDLRFNSEVKAYIELYTVKKREQVSRMMGLTQLYFPLFEEMLDKYNMPLELKYLAIVESALNPQAKSKAGAMGMWQFMYGTGKLYNLKVTSYVDERCDVYKATQAACEFLSSLYDIFGDWQLALAAYNSGPGNVSKAIRRSGGKRNYWDILPWLPRETQGYVPAFIAVNYVMNNTAEHNLYACAPRKTALDMDTVLVTHPITFAQLSKVLNIPIDDVRYFNPCYKKDFIPSPFNDVPYTLCLPKEKIGSFIANESAIYDYLKTDTAENAIASAQEVMKTHVVRKGEHINTIANRYKCTVPDIKKWNNLKSNYIKPGQRLVVYTPVNTNTAVAAKANTIPVAYAAATPAANNSSEDKYHKIQKGDTLWDIAQKYGTDVATLKKINNFGSNYKLLPGSKIKVSPST